MVRYKDENKDNPKNDLIPFNIQNFLFNKHVSIEKKTCKFYANGYGKVDRRIHKWIFSLSLIIQISTSNHQK